MGRRLKVPAGSIFVAEPGAQLNGLHCSECGELQFETESGAVCKNGHGGADGIGPQDAAKLKAKLAEETSKQLKQEMTTAEIDTSRSRARITFASANAAKKSAMRPDIVRLVETQVFVKDIDAVVTRLIEELQLGEQRSDHASVVKALDRAQDNARIAHSVYVTCVREREAWEKRNDVLFAGMRVEADKALQEQKDKGHRNKTITNDDVNAMMALLFGDEWVVQCNERKDYKLAEEHMKNLADRWSDRSHNLQAIASKLR